MGKTVKDINYSFEHTKQRLKERYNIDIQRSHYDHLCEKIKQNKDVELIESEYQENDTQHIYDISFRYTRVIRVVWSEKRQYITTALKRR